MGYEIVIYFNYILYLVEKSYLNFFYFNVFDILFFYLLLVVFILGILYLCFGW